MSDSGGKRRRFVHVWIGIAAVGTGLTARGAADEKKDGANADGTKVLISYVRVNGFKGFTDTLTILPNGAYEVHRVTKRPGREQTKLLKSGKLDTQTVVSLLGLASDCGFFQLEDLYDAFPPRATERPTTTITTALGKRS